MYTALTPMQLHKALDSLDGIQALRRFNSILVGGAAPHPHRNGSPAQGIARYEDGA